MFKILLTSSVRSFGCSILLILLASSCCIAGLSDTTLLRVRSVSDSMYYQGNPKYMIVDAVIDGWIVLPNRVRFTFLSESYWVISDGRDMLKLPDSVKSRYAVKFFELLSAAGETGGAAIRLSATPDNTPLGLADIFDTASAFRNFTVRDRYRAGITSNGWRAIIAELQKDRFIQNRYIPFEMHYAPGYIEINGIKLAGEMNEKYCRLFRDSLGLDLRTDPVSGILKNEDLKRYLSDFK